MLIGKASVTLFLEAEQHIKVQIKHERFSFQRELISFFLLSQELKDLQFSSVRPSVHPSSSSLLSSLNLHHSSSAHQAFLLSLFQISWEYFLGSLKYVVLLICYLSFTSLKRNESQLTTNLHVPLRSYLCFRCFTILRLFATWASWLPLLFSWDF